MSISAQSIRFDDDSMWVDLSDGRIVGVPLVWFPRLLKATWKEYKLRKRALAKQNETTAAPKNRRHNRRKGDK